jgi:hypothetical protein
MRCQVCGKGDQLDDVTCRFCGATVRSVLGTGMPLPPEINDLHLTREKNRERQSSRRRRRLLWHTAVGAIILFGAGVFVNVVTLIYVPKKMLLGILAAIPIALVFGPPIGLITSWRNYGPLGGAFVGVFFFSIGIYLLGVGPLYVCVLLSVLPGISVGGLMGVHVSVDEG